MDHRDRARSFFGTRINQHLNPEIFASGDAEALAAGLAAEALDLAPGGGNPPRSPYGQCMMNMMVDIWFIKLILMMGIYTING